MAVFILLFTFLFGWNGMVFQNEKEFKTEIREVTVFLHGAQVFETGTVQIPAGESVLKIPNRTAFMDDKSLQVKGIGNFSILSVNHRSNFLETRILSKNDSLQSLLDGERLILDKLNAEAEVLKERYTVLNANKDLGGQNNGITMLQLKQAVDFFEKEITDIKEKEIQNKLKSADSRKAIEKLEKQLNENQNQSLLPVSEIIIRVEADHPTQASFSLSYLVSNAGWFPKYDIRVKNVRDPLELSYKAEVWQNTGDDWKNVKLRFSNGEPNRSGVKPDLKKWELTYAGSTIYDPAAAYGPVGTVSGMVTNTNGEVLPGVSILVKGSSIGTVTDINGRYSITLPNDANRLIFSFIGMIAQELPVSGSNLNVRLEDDLQQLSEVTIAGFDSRALQGRVAGLTVNPPAKKLPAETVATIVRESQTTVEIEVEKPYSIVSNGDKLQVDLKKYNLDAAYEYYVVPKLEKEAFLIAKIVDWEQYSFLEGEANLYFEDTFIGRSILEARSLQDTISISLGRDKGIVVQREKVEQFSRKRTVGSNINESRGYKITIKNNKSQAVDLIVIDHIPVPVISDISVSANELSGGSLEADTGLITWKMALTPAEQRELELGYEVRYPRREKVILD